MRSASMFARALPGFALIVAADVAAVAGAWTVLAVVVICVIDGLADGVFAWLRARASWAAGLAVILVAKTAIDLALAVLERLRVARIKAAVAAGITVEPRPAEKRASAPRGGRKRRKR